MAVNRRFAMASAGILATASAVLIVFRDGVRDPSSATAGPDPSTCSAMWQRGFELTGVVGERETQAYFDSATVAGQPHQLSGIAVFPRERTNTPLADAPMGLAGPGRSDACAAELTERESDANGVWSLRIESASRVTGQRRLSGGRSEAIAFTLVPETVCDGAGEWRTFTSPDWPMTFDYPASWSITADRDDITVECPSVTQLAFGGRWLTFEQGRFVPRGRPSHEENVAAFSEPFWFVRVANDDWRVSETGCGAAPPDAAASCRPARRSQRHGITILQAEAGEHRLHRAGIGYLGPGPGITRYLFIAGDRWVSLDAAASNSPRRDIGADGGPVLLDVQRVGDRIVQSVRRR